MTYLKLVRKNKWVLKSKKKQLAVTLFYCLDQETWLDDSWKRIHINQSRFRNFSVVNNKPPASLVMHITTDFHPVIPVYTMVPC